MQEAWPTIFKAVLDSWLGLLAYDRGCVWGSGLAWAWDFVGRYSCVITRLAWAGGGEL